MRSLRVLEVSLRKAGYNLTTCASANDAIETLEYAQPDLILSDTRLVGMDGFAFVEALRKNPDWGSIPMMFLSSDTSVESKVRGLQLGVEDYLTKPIYTKEILARIHLALNRRERDSFARGRASLSKTRFTGSLEDMGLVDLLQTIDVSRKSGVLELRSASGHGTITFGEGQILDAELGRIHGERAVYRLLLWSEGDFDIEFRPVRSEARIRTPTTGLLMEGMRRVDEWGRVLEQLPPLDAVLEVVETELLPRLAEIPDELNAILRAIDGKSTLGEIVDSVPGDDLATLGSISKLFFEGVVQPARGSRTLRPGPASEEADAVVGEDVEPDHRITASRADPDVSGTAVPQNSSIVPPPAAAEGQESTSIPPISMVPAPLPADQDGGATGGTASATHALPPPPQPTKGGRDPRRTLVGPGFDDAVDNIFASFDAPSPSPSPSVQPSQPPHGSSVPGSGPKGDFASPASPISTAHEDPMAKKNKKNKGAERSQSGPPPEASKRVEASVSVETRTEPAVQAEAVVAPVVAPVVARHEEKRDEKRDEAASNIIQFPTQAKRTVTQVAVNDDVVAGGSRSEASEPAKDETQPRLKTDDDKPAARAEAPKAESKSERPEARSERPVAKSERETKGERPAAKSAAAEDEPKTEEERRERRKKKTQTESAQMRAIGTGEHAVVTEEFFQAPKVASPDHHDDFADLQHSLLEPMSSQSKQWMYATVGIFLVATVVIGAYWYYQNVHLPQPVALGQAGPLELPRIAAGTGERPATEGTAEQPTARPTEQPTAEQPTAEQVAAEPTAEEVAAAEAAAAEAAAQLAAAEALAAQPTVEQPVVEQPAVVAEVAPPVAPPVAPAAAGETYESVLAQAVAARGAARQIPLLERAIELNPSGADALARLSYIYVGRGGRGNLEQARGLAERATAADPTSSQGWLVLGAARGELGDRVGARAAYQSCVESGQGRWVTDCRSMLR